MAPIFSAIAVLGGSLAQTPNGRWRTTDFGEGDAFGHFGDRLRVAAAHKLYNSCKKDNPSLLIIASGSNERVDPDGAAPAVAEVLKNELVELGVEPARILEERKSTGTHQQIREVGRMSAKLNLERVAILSNEYHLPRIRAMIEHVPALADLKKMLEAGKLALVSAEKVLLDHDHANWEKIIARAYESAAMKQRIKLEKMGVEQIKSGTYKFP